MRRFTSVILVAFLSLVLVASTQAQLAVGLRAGYNGAKITIKEDGTSVEDIKMRSGFFAGADLAFMLSPMFGIEVGGAYSQKGAKSDLGTGTDVTIKVDYIDVPLLFVVSVPTSGNIMPRLFAGGVASFEMSCKFSDGSTSLDCTDDDLGARKSNYFSALFGAGIGLAAGPGSVLLDVGYQLGLTNISDEEGLDVKSNVIQASLGYRFPLGN